MELIASDGRIVRHRIQRAKQRTGLGFGSPDAKEVTGLFRGLQAVGQGRGQPLAEGNTITVRLLLSGMEEIVRKHYGAVGCGHHLNLSFIIIPGVTMVAPKRSGTRANLALDNVGYIHNLLVVHLLDTTFAALSDPTRRAMIERLSRGPASVRGLTEPFELSQQMISKHIATLVRARIVVKKKRGRESVCSLRPEAIKTVNDWAANYRRLWEERLDRLEVVVNQMKKAEVKDGK